jgi:hypothetical protein
MLLETQCYSYKNLLALRIKKLFWSYSFIKYIMYQRVIISLNISIISIKIMPILYNATVSYIIIRFLKESR